MFYHRSGPQSSCLPDRRYAGVHVRLTSAVPAAPEPSGEPVLMELRAPGAAPLRADAARNRARLLEAAARLVERSRGRPG